MDHDAVETCGLTMAAPAGEREVLVEIVVLGAYAKVTAIDAATGTEVSVTGPAAADQRALRAAAIRKLEFVLKKRNGGC